MTARLVVLISGNGSNLQAILDACSSRELNAQVVSVISNKADAYGLVRAKNAGVEVIHFPKLENESRNEYDARLAELVAAKQSDYVVLAGWMRLLTSSFLNQFPNRVINLHPALPGTFPGTHAIERAFEAYQRGEIIQTGFMVHLVPDEGVDNGPVLATEIVPIDKDDTLETLETRVHETEHKLLVSTIKALLENSIMVGKLTWKLQGDSFYAKVLDCQAIARNAGSRFIASIVDNSGIILQNAHEEFDDIEAVENWVLFTLVDMEQSDSTDIAKQRMLTTLDKAAESIREHVHGSHIERLSRIRNWVIDRHIDIEVLLTPKKETLQTLEWDEINSKTFSASTPHGKAVILEKGVTAHETWIEHNSGVKLKSFETFIDFLDAENWVQKALNHLDDPSVNEVNLDSINFTLEICQRLLPHNIDPLINARLEYLEALLGEILP